MNYNSLLVISPTSQRLLNWFVFFIAFPCVSFLGNSVTFYLFIVLILKHKKFLSRKFRWKWVFNYFFIFATISGVIAPYHLMDDGVTFSSSVVFLIQYCYWILVAIYIIVLAESISLYDLSRWVFYGSLASILSFFIISVKYDIIFLNINFAPSRNALVFNLLCTTPLSLYYIFIRYTRISLILWSLFFLIAMLLTQGRAGSVLIIVELFFFYIIILGPNSRRIAYTSVLFGVLVLLFHFLGDQGQLKFLSKATRVVNPRLADLVEGSGQGDLDFNKSWLHRELMIDKSLEIFEEYPLLGIGPGNFTNFSTPLETYDDIKYVRLTGHSPDYYNKRSAHNSYAQLLAENGTIGLTMFIVILIFPLLYFLNQFLKGRLNLNSIFIIPLLAISIHFYAISSHTGTITWLIIGTAWISFLGRTSIK